jgi:hypothetical protein
MPRSAAGVSQIFLPARISCFTASPVNVNPHAQTILIRQSAVGHFDGNLPVFHFAQFLDDQGDIESAMLRVAPPAKQSESGLRGQLESAVEAMKSVPCTVLQKLKAIPAF